MVSTIGDYSKFASMLANGGVYEGKRYLSEEDFRYMTTPKLSPIQHSYFWEKLSGYSYGALMRIMVNKEASSVKTCNGEFGWDGWTGTYFCADAENKIAVLYFTQICGAGTTYQASEISRIAYENFAEKN
ncbi:MAG: beta-lactamase family protein [Ruminococcus flavefaciens]|nr:beta-lactamase family protein [Ruminococcus flavefaciens]MCM1061320.1 beta-lactamase family protein [Eubacterium sp.]